MVLEYALAPAIIIFVNLDAVLDAHAERHVRILEDAVELLADMRTVEIQFQDTIHQTIPERHRNHVGHTHICIVYHRDMAGRTLFDNLRDVFVT